MLIMKKEPQNSMCCVKCCFCCGLGYHDVFFQKIQTHSFQKSIYSIKFIPFVKKLHDFEIPE